MAWKISSRFIAFTLIEWYIKFHTHLRLESSWNAAIRISSSDFSLLSIYNPLKLTSSSSSSNAFDAITEAIKSIGMFYLAFVRRDSQSNVLIFCLCNSQFWHWLWDFFYNAKFDCTMHTIDLCLVIYFFLLVGFVYENSN